jgi:hypothetical protein
MRSIRSLVVAVAWLLAAAGAPAQQEQAPRAPAPPPSTTDVATAVADMHKDVAKRLRELEAKMDRIVEYLRLDQRNTLKEDMDQRLTEMKRSIDEIARDVEDTKRAVDRLDRK